MSVPDHLMGKYFALVTDLPASDIRNIETKLASGELHPRDAKMLLARTIVTMYCGTEAAEQAEQDFVTVFQQGGVPETVSAVTWGNREVPILDALVELNLLKSKSEARRMIENRGVRVNGDIVTDLRFPLVVSGETLLQVGKRVFLRLLP